MSQSIAVGILGATLGRGWAAQAHVPAIRALPGLTLVAVGTTTQVSAEAAANAFEVPLAFGSHAELVARPEIDLVVVSVKVPHHLELVGAALEAGKAVYSEWPLGRDLDEGRRLARLARAKDVATVVGLQARSAPVINYLRDLVRDGYVGTVLSTTMVGSFLPGAGLVQANAYQANRNNGANLLTIPVGHCVDALCYCLGELVELNATLDVRRPTISVLETGERIEKTAPDQVAVIGRLAGGATAAIHFRQGLAGGTNLLWEINGTHGTLRVTAPGWHVGIFPSALTGRRGQGDSLSPLLLPSKYFEFPPYTAALGSLAGTPAHSVAWTYARFANDRHEGTKTVPDFDDAVNRHHMIAAIEFAAETGARQSLATAQGS